MTAVTPTWHAAPPRPDILAPDLPYRSTVRPPQARAGTRRTPCRMCKSRRLATREPTARNQSAGGLRIKIRRLGPMRAGAWSLPPGTGGGCAQGGNNGP